MIMSKGDYVSPHQGGVSDKPSDPLPIISHPEYDNVDIGRGLWFNNVLHALLPATAIYSIAIITILRRRIRPTHTHSLR